jgi:hypothetical protein
VRDRYRDGSIELELIDMLASDERVALLVRERFHGHGPPVEIRRANVYRVQGGLIVEVSIFEADQYLGRRRLALGRPSPTTADAADRLSSRGHGARVSVASHGPRSRCR